MDQASSSPKPSLGADPQKHLKIILHLKNKLAQLNAAHKKIVTLLKKKLDLAQTKIQHLERALQEERARKASDYAAMMPPPMAAPIMTLPQGINTDDFKKGSLSQTQLEAIKKHFETEIGKQVKAIADRDEKIRLLEQSYETENKRNNRIEKSLEVKSAELSKALKLIANLEETCEKNKNELLQSREKIRTHTLSMSQAMRHKDEDMSTLKIANQKLSSRVLELETITKVYNMMKLQNDVIVLKNKVVEMLKKGKEQTQLKLALDEVVDLGQVLNISRSMTKENLENLYGEIFELESRLKNCIYDNISQAV